MVGASLSLSGGIEKKQVLRFAQDDKPKGDELKSRTSLRSG